MERSRRVFGILAGAILAGGVVFNLVWHPTPNRVVIDVKNLSGDAVLQLYYQYDRAGLRDYFEYRSDVEFVHRGEGVRRVEFRIPGGRDLRRLRLDVGPPGAAFTVTGVEFGHSFAYGFTPLARRDPAGLAERIEPLGGSVERVDGAGVRLRGGAEDAGWELRPPPGLAAGTGSLSGRDLWSLRGQRIAVAVLAAGLVFLAGRWVTGGAGPRGRWPSRGLAALLAVGWLAALAFLVYEPFLVFRKWYLFRDVATDSVDSFWPMFAHLGELWRSEGVPFWSFAAGLGAPVYGWVGDPFLFALWNLPGEWLPFGMGWAQFLKTVGAGGLFFLWLRRAGLAPLAAAAAAAGLAFSAHMAIRGAWFHYATEVFLVAFALWAVEERLRSGRGWPVVAAAALLCLRGPYGLALWSVLLGLYVCARLWARGSFRPTVVLRWLPLYLLGIGIGAVVLLPNAANLFLSPRVSGPEAQTLDLLGRPLLALNPPTEWLSSLAGLFAPDLLGKGNVYSGWRNYLEGPHFYGGLFAVLLLPQAFVGRSARARVLLGSGLLAVALYVLVPHARFLLNAYTVSYYKTSSFWVTLFLAGSSALALDNLLRRGILRAGLLWTTAAVCLGFLLWLRFGSFPAEWIRIAESRLVFRQAVALLLLYAVALSAMAWGRRGGVAGKGDRTAPAALVRRTGGLLFVVLLSGEVFLFAGGVQRERWTLRADTAATGGLYADDAAAAAALVASADDGFYRIARESMSVQLNDALLQGYFGLRSYNSFQPSSTLRFLGRDGFAAPYRYGRLGNSYLDGLGDRYALETLLSVKYAFAVAGGPPPAPGYRPWGRAGEVAIWENRAFVPFGSVYRRVVSEERLAGARAGGTAEDPTDGSSPLSPPARDLVAFAAAIVPAEEMERTGLPRLPEEAIRERREAAGDPEGFERLYLEDARRLGKNHLRIDRFSHHEIAGTVETAGPGLLFFPVPAEPGWRFFVDGERRESVVVHYGFQGLPVRAGERRIRLSYVPPLLEPAVAVSLASLAAFGIWFVVLPLAGRLRRPGGPGDVSR